MKLILHIFAILLMACSIDPPPSSSIKLDQFSDVFSSSFNVESLQLETIKGMNKGVSMTDSEFEVKSRHFESPMHIVFIGNSIAYHGPLSEIGWYTGHGMAASKAENDYAHVLSKKLSVKFNRNVIANVFNFSEFEANYDTFNFERLDKVRKIKADYYVFQLSENVSALKMGSVNFEDQYLKFVKLSTMNGSKNRTIILTTPFFPLEQKSAVIFKVAKGVNGYVADVSKLAVDEKNYSRYDKKWDNSGIGEHPGDMGMKNIAQVIFNVIENNSHSK